MRGTSRSGSRIPASPWKCVNSRSTGVMIRGQRSDRGEKTPNLVVLSDNLDFVGLFGIERTRLTRFRPHLRIADPGLTSRPGNLIQKSGHLFALGNQVLESVHVTLVFLQALLQLGSTSGHEDLGHPVVLLQLLQSSLLSQANSSISRRTPIGPEEEEQDRSHNTQKQGVSLFRIVRYQCHGSTRSA